MSDWLIFLLALGFIFSPFLVIIYLMEVHLEDDWFFFMRKTLIRRKLRKRGMKGADELADSLFRTSASEWHYDRRSETITFHPFSDKRITAHFGRNGNKYWLQLDMGPKTVARLRMDDQREASDVSSFDNTLEHPSNRLKWKHLGCQLIGFYDEWVRLDNRRDEQEKEEAAMCQLLEEEEAERLKKTERERFESALSDALSSSLLWKTNESGPFRLDTHNHDVFTAVSLSCQNEVCYNALSKDGVFDSDIPAGNGALHALMVERKDAIDDYMKRLMHISSAHKTGKETPVGMPAVSRTLPKNIWTKWVALHEQLADIALDRHFLDETNAHLVTVTYPEDLSRLLSAYMDTDKETSSQMFSETLSHIGGKLAGFKELIQQEKNRVFERETRIITARADD